MHLSAQLLELREADQRAQTSVRCVIAVLVVHSIGAEDYELDFVPSLRFCTMPSPATVKHPPWQQLKNVSVAAASGHSCFFVLDQ